jgi:outer membrane lipoprotein SlyB
MTMRKLSLLSSISALALITACSSTPPRNDAVYNVPAATTGQGVIFGNVSRIEIVPVATPTSGGGAVVGAVLGGVLGHQFGSGSGRDAATAVGVVGGALIGNQVEKSNQNNGEIYRISVRLDNGSMAQFDFQSVGDLRVGDRVKVQDGQLFRA